MDEPSLTQEDVMRKRSERRHSEAIAKKKARTLIHRVRLWIGGIPSPEEEKRLVGKQAAVHSRPCSCPGCGNARRHLKQKTLQELREDFSDKEQGLRQARGMMTRRPSRSVEKSTTISVEEPGCE